MQLDVSGEACSFLVFFLDLVGPAGASLDVSGATCIFLIFFLDLLGAAGASLDASGAIVTWTFFGFFLARFGLGGVGGGASGSGTGSVQVFLQVSKPLTSFALSPPFG